MGTIKHEQLPHFSYPAHAANTACRSRRSSRQRSSVQRSDSPRREEYDPYFGPMSALCCIFPGMAFPCIMWPMLVICPLDHREVVVTTPDGAVVTAQQIQPQRIQRY